MEDVEKRIGKIKKAHERDGLLCCFGRINTIIGYVIIIIMMIMMAFKLESPMIVVYIGGGSFTAAIALHIASYTLMKHASKEVEELKHNYVRLKLVSQGYFDFCSFFISPDETTFLQGPKIDDEKTLIIYVWEDGTIDSSKMTKEELEAMFEPMFK